MKSNKTHSNPALIAKPTMIAPKRVSKMMLKIATKLMVMSIAETMVGGYC